LHFFSPDARLFAMRTIGVILLAVWSAQAGEFAVDGKTVRFDAEPAKAWTAMFRRSEGWTGADGIFSFHDSEQKKTYFVFSDTWIGSVDWASGQRRQDS
jgi:hypothetical protein